MPPLDQNERLLMPPLNQRDNGENAEESGDLGLRIRVWIFLILFNGGYTCIYVGVAILWDYLWGTHRVKPQLRSINTGLALLGIGIGLWLVFFAICWVYERFAKGADAEGQRSTAQPQNAPEPLLGSCCGFGHGGEVGTGDDFGDGGDAGGDFGGADFGD
jgi:hypothetical protein